jgi:predicted nucleic acid-binding protein
VLVVNTSPLIHSAKAGLLDLLWATAEEIWVPEPVAREVLAYGDADPTASALASSPW